MAASTLVENKKEGRDLQGVACCRQSPIPPCDAYLCGVVVRGIANTGGGTVTVYLSNVFVETNQAPVFCI